MMNDKTNGFLLGLATGAVIIGAFSIIMIFIAGVI